MKRVRNFIRTKRKKTEFELRVMQNFDEYYHQALHAEKGLEPLDHDQAGNRLFLCHGDLDQHHILLLPESQTAAFTGLARCIWTSDERSVPFYAESHGKAWLG